MNYSVTQRGLFLAQSTQKAQMLQTVFNIGYEKFEDTQCRFFQAQSKSRGNRVNGSVVTGGVFGVLCAAVHTSVTVRLDELVSVSAVCRLPDILLHVL